jgi:phospholipase/carboxylesterase
MPKRGPAPPSRRSHAAGHLDARPRDLLAADGALLTTDGAVAQPLPARGAQPLGLGGARDGLLHVPASYAPERPAPLVVLLHGAGGDGRGILPLLRPHAEARGFVVVAPDSRQATWDVIQARRYGPDVAFLDAALADVFARCTIDPARVAVAGFSDGASYALSLGVANGALFSHVIAFSPGFMAPPAQEGAPRIFVSHGRGDTVLPIDPCSRRVVPELRRADYDVRYVEFDGGHSVPPTSVEEATAWFAG